MSAYELEIEEILRSIFEIKKQSDFFYEQDTIERVIVPVLRLVFGPSLDDVTTHMLVRDNRKNRGTGQSADLNIYLNGQLKFAIECKCCRDDFSPQRSEEKNGFWSPKVDENIFKIQKDGEFTCKEEWLRRLEKKLANKGYEANAVLGMKNISEKLFDANGENIEKWSLDQLAESEKVWLTQLSAISFASATNEKDYIGQVWRYGNDGLHWRNEHTKVVWTNGRRWLLFEDFFWEKSTWPRVKVEGGAFVGEPYFRTITFPNVEEDRPFAEQMTFEFVANWYEKLIELRSAFGVTTNENP